MNLNDQIKTSQGRIFVKDVALESSDMVFTPLSPDAAASMDCLAAEGKPRSSVEDLSLLLQWRNGAMGFSQEDALSLARETGPLFGGACVESVFDWACVAAVARGVVELQEVINGGKPLALASRHIVKTVAENVETGSSFTIFLVSFDMGPARNSSAYFNMLPAFPWMKKFKQTGAFDYAIVEGGLSEDESGNSDGRMYLDVSLLSFEREITARDFAAVAAYFQNVQPQDLLSALYGGRGERNDVRAQAGEYAISSAAPTLKVVESDIQESDLAHIQRLVHTLISLHFQGITVDVFQSSEGDDFMCFNSYLSNMWYLFSRKLGQVKIGYCERCGKPFSLTGHRGIKRRFCGQKCKTDAKNQRSKQLRDDARAMFWNGCSVREIAAQLYPDEPSKKAYSYVLAHFEGWVELKHEVDAAIVVKDYRPDIVKRCVADGVLSKEWVVQRRELLAGQPRLVKAALRRAHQGQGQQS